MPHSAWHKSVPENSVTDARELPPVPIPLFRFLLGTRN